MYFNTKNYLKNAHNHIIKQAQMSGTPVFLSLVGHKF